MCFLLKIFDEAQMIRTVHLWREKNLTLFNFVWAQHLCICDMGNWVARFSFWLLVERRWVAGPFVDTSKVLQ